MAERALNSEEKLHFLEDAKPNTLDFSAEKRPLGRHARVRQQSSEAVLEKQVIAL